MKELTDEMIKQACEECEAARLAALEKHMAEHGKEMPPTPALDAFIGYMTGKVSGEDYVRIAREYGKDHWLIKPSFHGQDCFCNGDHRGIECECDECDHYMTCFPDWHPGAMWDEDKKCFI